MIKPSTDDIGRKVIYRGIHPDDWEEGTLSSFNNKYAFVRFGRSITGQACNFSSLEWSHATPDGTQGDGK